MTNRPSRSASNPDQPQQADNVAENDRMASNGDDYARDNNRSGEGNDAALTAGPTFERRVRADGTVESVPAEETGDDDADADDGQRSRDR